MAAKRPAVTPDAYFGASCIGTAKSGKFKGKKCADAWRVVHAEGQHCGDHWCRAVAGCTLAPAKNSTHAPAPTAAPDPDSRALVCVVGSIRTFALPCVHESIWANVLNSLGGPRRVDVNMILFLHENDELPGMTGTCSRRR